MKVFFQYQHSNQLKQMWLVALIFLTACAPDDNDNRTKKSSSILKNPEINPATYQEPKMDEDFAQELSYSDLALEANCSTGDIFVPTFMQSSQDILQIRLNAGRCMSEEDARLTDAVALRLSAGAENFSANATTQLSCYQAVWAIKPPFQNFPPPGNGENFHYWFIVPLECDNASCARENDYVSCANATFTMRYLK